MNLLLDTHALLWYAIGDPRLSPTARNAIADANHRVAMSVVSAWEIAIKLSSGKLQLDLNFREFVDGCTSTYQFVWLPVEPRHLVTVRSLPFYHRDPFDRMLIAQALTDDLTLVSTDTVFDTYAAKRLW